MSDPAFKLINQSSQGTLILCLTLTFSLEESTSRYHLCSPTTTHLPPCDPSGWHCLIPPQPAAPQGAAHLPIQGLQGVPRAVTCFSSVQGQGLLLLLCSNTRSSTGRWDSQSSHFAKDRHFLPDSWQLCPSQELSVRVFQLHPSHHFDWP